MTTRDNDAGNTNGTEGGEIAAENLEKLTENLTKVEELSKRLINAMSSKKPSNPALSAPDQELFSKAATAYWTQAMHNPAKLLEHQLEFWGKSVKHYVEAQQVLSHGKFEAPADPGPKDRRFSNPLWDTHPYFNFIKQQYLINSDALKQAVAQAGDLDPVEQRRLTYFTQQIVDMMAPTNFLATNPDALEKAIADRRQIACRRAGKPCCRS